MTPDTLLSIHANLRRNRSFIGPVFTRLGEMIAAFPDSEWEARDEYSDKVYELCNSRRDAFDSYLDHLMSDHREAGEGAEAAAVAVAAVDFDEFCDEADRNAAEAARDARDADNAYWGAVA